MKLTTTRSRSLVASDRLDARFFTAAGAGVTEKLLLLEGSGVEVVPLGSLGKVWDPPRFARAYARPNEPGLPYLRPYDVFDYLPVASDHLSMARNDDLAKLVPGNGVILQTCSGRNLGPCAIADDYLSQFALSHDMIRIEIESPDDRFYLLAFLRTSLGQQLLRRNMSGSVIDHLTTADVRAVPIPMLASPVRAQVSSLARRAYTAMSSARRQLTDVLAQQAATLPVPARTGPLREGWTIGSKELVDRLDVAYYDPVVRAVRRQVREADGIRCGDLATAYLPVRYKRYYVGSEHGRPILSGRQLLQADPVNLRYVSDRSFRNPELYELREGMTIFGAVGRAEGRQGAAALVTSERSGWLASNDVMRLTPRPGVLPASLWLAIASQQARLQINALSFGSVIDHMNPWDVENIFVPSIDPGLGAKAQHAWDLFDEANANHREATRILEDHLSAH